VETAILLIVMVLGAAFGLLQISTEHAEQSHIQKSGWVFSI
jgi:hypothetical protein